MVDGLSAVLKKDNQTFLLKLAIRSIVSLEFMFKCTLTSHKRKERSMLKWFRLMVVREGVLQL